jgi:hypothetical protein
MRTLKALAALAAIAGMLTVAAIGGDTLLLGTLIPVDGTTNTTAIAAGGVSYPGGWFTIQHGGITATSAVTLTAQMSFDQTNYFNVAVWTPPLTNAGSYSWLPSFGTQAVYLRVQAVTTNEVSLGGTFHN